MIEKMSPKPVISWLILALLLASCASQPQTPTSTPAQTPTMKLSITENECTFEYPSAIVNGEFRIQLTLNEKRPTDSGFALVTLDTGKTLEDLKAATADQPVWVFLIVGVHETSVGTHLYSYDSTQFTKYSQFYKGGPLYLACFHTDPDSGVINKIGTFGPIEIK